MKPLTNSQWGFESNCFVCEPTNVQGLQIPFYYDEGAEVVVADFELGSPFSGAPTYVHGGVVLAILDEAMAWATIAITKTFAVTHSTTTTFERPVRVGRAYRVAARIDSTDADRIHTRATVTDAKERICATASAEFVALGPTKATEATGAELYGRDATFVRESDQPKKTAPTEPKPV